MQKMKSWPQVESLFNRLIELWKAEGQLNSKHRKLNIGHAASISINISSISSLLEKDIEHCISHQIFIHMLKDVDFLVDN